MKTKTPIRLAARRSFIAGIKAADCQVVTGGFPANTAHFTKLLSAAGMKAADFDALFEKAHAKKETIFGTMALRAELHNRGILPLANRPAGTGDVLAGADADAPAELVQAVTNLSKLVDTIQATLPPDVVQGAAAVGALVATLRAEMKSLANRLDAGSVRRKAEILKQIRKVEDGTYNAKGLERSVQLLAEITTLQGRLDGPSARRRVEICAELRKMRVS
jgi:hypothetical protein